MRRLAIVLCVLCSLACESRAALGAGCTRNAECAAPLVCRIEHCRSECVANRDCPLGTVCLLDEEGLGACSVPADTCTTGGVACPEPLTCVNARCLNTCSVGTDCPDDGECRALPGADISFCFAPDGTDGGTNPDAGSDAGADAAMPAPAGAPLCLGAFHTCAITGGHVVCWGWNEGGELGDGDSLTMAHDQPESCGTDDCSSTGVTVLDEDGVPLTASALACSYAVTCAVTTGGAIACWGNTSSNGPLSGDPAVFNPQRAHIAPDLGSGFTEIAAGRVHFCARRPAGSPHDTVCWGDSGSGQMGLGASAVAMGGGIFEDVGTVLGGGVLALGEHFTCVARDSDVLCAGDDDAGHLGPMATAFPMNEPTPVGSPGPLVATELAAGNGHLCALLVDHSIVCRGWNGYGSLGHTLGNDDCSAVTGAFGPCDRDFAPIMSSSSFSHLWGTGGFTSFVCAQETNTETVYCWGAFDSGTCLTTAAVCSRPTRVPAFDHATYVAVGLSAVCATFADGHVTCIGDNQLGQLGRGSIAPDATPLRDDVHVLF